MSAQPEQPAPTEAPQPVLSHRRFWAWATLFPSHSIRTRLQLSHLLTSLLPLLALGFALLFTTAQAERRIVEQTQRSVAESIAVEISGKLREYDADLLSFGRQISLRPENRVGTQATTRMFMSQHFPDVLEIAILDLDGQEVVRMSQKREYFADELRQRAAEVFFALARQGSIHHSTTMLDGEPVVQIAVASRNGIGQVTGVVVAALASETIQQRLAAVSPATARSTFLYSADGTVVLGNAPPTLTSARDLVQWMPSEDMVSTLRDSAGHTTIAARAMVAPTSWWVVVEQPTDVAFFSLRRNTWLLGLMLLITTGVVVWWGMFIAREMTRPILQLRDGVNIVASGQLGGSIKVGRDDELGHLAQEFNRMSERLAISQHALEDHNARLREGLELARHIQRDLLPHGPPPDRALVAHAASESATEIGGDFYTYVPLADGRTRLVIGDVSGKGVAAALVMAHTSSLVEAEARDTADPTDLLLRLNAELYPRLHPSRMSVALLVAEFDPAQNLLRVANAGMITPLVVGPDTCEYIPSYGPPLGVVPDVTYETITITLPPEHAVVFVSDGIVEARNAANDMWGFPRLEATVCSTARAGSARIVARVLEALRQFSGTTAPADDMTIIAASLVARSEEDHVYATAPDEPLDLAGERAAARSV